MNRSVVVKLALVPCVMAPLSILGQTGALEPWLWLGFTVAAAIALARAVPDRLGRHAMATGVAWGVLHGLLQSLFFDTYLDSNPQHVEDFEQITFMDPRWFPLAAGVLPGLMSGVMLWVLGVFFRRRDAEGGGAA